MIIEAICAKNAHTTRQGAVFELYEEAFLIFSPTSFAFSFSFATFVDNKQYKYITNNRCLQMEGKVKQGLF